MNLAEEIHEYEHLDDTQYEQHLFDDTLDGYIQVIQIKKDEKLKIYNM